MNPTYFGDSYDLVKRFFCCELMALGYEVVIDPMFTGAWEGREANFFRLIGAVSKYNGAKPTALFVDPDTGVNNKGGKQHISFDRLANEASKYELVFSFDQSFSRQHKPTEIMGTKLAAMRDRGCHAMYYDSHARFLFVSKQEQVLHELRNHVVLLGLPTERLPLI